jgi:hypothetical protein
LQFPKIPLGFPNSSDRAATSAGEVGRNPQRFPTFPANFPGNDDAPESRHEVIRGGGGMADSEEI